MNARSRPWEIAADLEKAAIAVRAARQALIDVHSDAWDRINQIDGMEFFDNPIASDLQALSDKYQAIADAEVVL